MSQSSRSADRPRAVPRPTLKVGKGERTRAKILDAALEFLWSHPYRDMTVGAVMAGTDLSRSAFYRHFRDLHAVMETLLFDLEREILDGISPWLSGTGSPIDLLHDSLAGLVRVCHRRGPIARAIVDSAPTDERLDELWSRFMGRFDHAVEARIESDRRQGLISDLDARNVARALNRLNVAVVVDSFGRRPRMKQKPVVDVLFRIWCSTLYGAETLDPKQRSQS